MSMSRIACVCVRAWCVCCVCVCVCVLLEAFAYLCEGGCQAGGGDVPPAVRILPYLVHDPPPDHSKSLDGCDKTKRGGRGKSRWEQ